MLGRCLLANEINQVKGEELIEKKELDIDDKYILGPGDVLDLNLFDAKEFSGKYKILNDGSVSFPLVGRVLINNLSIQDASNKLQKLYSKELLRPELYLSLSSSRPIKISIIGEVERPGIYSLSESELLKTEGSPDIKTTGMPTLIDAIQKAGGITKKSNLKKVVLIRKLPGEDQQYKKTTIDLVDLIFKGNHSQNPYLFDGDIIKLEKILQPQEDILSIAKANLSPKKIQIYVVGEVKEPGLIEVDSNTLLTQAIMFAGGPIDLKTNKRNIELLRIERNGKATLKKYRFNLSTSASVNKNPVLKNGDIIKLNPALLAKTANALGVVTEPMRDLITAFSLFKLISN